MDYEKICINCMHLNNSGNVICPNCGFDPMTYRWPSHALAPFTILHGKYLVGRILGSGGFGITYIAYDMVLQCPRAIKEFFLQGAMYRYSSESTGVSVINSSFSQEQMYKVNREKFMQEARILARLDYLPGIVRVHDFFNENDTSYIVMEYLDGETLKDYVERKGGKLSWEETLGKIRPLIKSLQQLHNKNIFHRDISPDNIMVLRDGTLKLFDFGGARVQDPSGENHSVIVMKKTGYTPVEQYSNGPQGAWTDEYALSATIYYCITGQVPAESVARAAEPSLLIKPSQLAPELPARQEAAILKGLGLRKEDRYPDLYDFEKNLFNFADEASDKDSKTGRKELKEERQEKKEKKENQDKKTPEPKTDDRSQKKEDFQASSNNRKNGSKKGIIIGCIVAIAAVAIGSLAVLNKLSPAPPSGEPNEIETSGMTATEEALITEGAAGSEEETDINETEIPEMSTTEEASVTERTAVTEEETETPEMSTTEEVPVTERITETEEETETSEMSTTEEVSVTERTAETEEEIETQKETQEETKPAPILGVTIPMNPETETSEMSTTEEGSITEVITETEEEQETQEETESAPAPGEAIPMVLGTYIFENARDRNYIMGIDGGFGDDGTAVVLKDYEDSNKNRFFITDEDITDGFYNLRAAHTSSFIETSESQETGETVRQFAEMYHAGTEKWSFVYCGHDDEKDMDEVIIQNAAGSVLAPADGNMAPGTEIVLSEFNMEDDAQKWYVRWSEKDPSEADVVVYHEGDLVENISGTFNVASALDGKTSVSINRDETYHPEPTAVVFYAEWLTTEDYVFEFEFIPTGYESRYKIFPLDQVNGEHKCLEYNPDTSEIVMREESDSENQLFRIIYVRSNTYLIQTFNESVLGFDLHEDGSAEGAPVVARPYDSFGDSRVESWLLQIPHSPEG